MINLTEALEDVLDRAQEIEGEVDCADYEAALDLTQSLLDEVETLRAALRERLS